MRLYNTLTRRLEEVAPIEPGRIRMYTCGPTVYRYVHLGNLRTFLLSDLVRRVAAFEGYAVTQVINVTDVGHMTDELSDAGRDRMDLAVADEGLSPAEVAEKYTRAFLEDAAAIGILPPDVLPKATEHIPEMLDMIERLLKNGHAYEVGGNVYFDVSTFPDYGKLSGNTLERLRAGHRQDLEIDPNKRHPADFALWKRAGTGRLMKWDSPWGEGYPGWHVECSAMSMKYLGDRFDVHTGGVDLIFPHHEDEIAQSAGSVGHGVVSTWVHGGHLRLREQRMAKSTGNIIRIGDLTERGFDPLSFRYLTFQTRYRSEMDFSEDAMRAADTAVKRLRQRMAEWAEASPGGGGRELGSAADGGKLDGAGGRDKSGGAVDGGGPILSAEARDLDRRFREAVGNDLDMPAALVVVNEAAGAAIPAHEKYALLASWDAVLGLDLERRAKQSWAPSEEVRALVAERDRARSARDYAKSDELRERLLAMGLEVMDAPEGTRVRPRT